MGVQVPYWCTVLSIVIRSDQSASFMKNPTDRASLVRYLRTSRLDTEELGMTLVLYLVEHQNWIEENDLLRQDPLRYVEEIDYFNEILGFTKHLVDYGVLKGYGLVM